MYRKEQGVIVSQKSPCLEIFTISNFQRRVRNEMMWMTFWLKRKVQMQIYILIRDKPECDILDFVSVLRKGRGGWQLEQLLNVKLIFPVK